MRIQYAVGQAGNWSCQQDVSHMPFARMRQVPVTKRAADRQLGIISKAASHIIRIDGRHPWKLKHGKTRESYAQ